MALFGFNKAKVLSAAEKYVQSGKLPQAITEYEKVAKEDPKDLIVLNTIGDLSSRIGDNAKATEYFKRVGEAYATDGFTVKAIANYKKLTKLNPGATDIILRLAELYTTQGLYNDARAQYVAIADSYLKAGQNEDAAKTFKKILELDPENTTMQQKLADLYMKLGKKNEARDIYFTAAQSLYAKQSMDQADEALAKVLSLDPKNVDALLLRGNIAAESGNASQALEFLEQVPDLDASPEGLRSLLRAHLMLGHTADCSPLAAKLVEKHNDLSGVSWLAETFIKNAQYLQGLDLFKTYSDQIIAANAQALLKALIAVENLVKDDAPSIEILRELFKKVGDHSHDGTLAEMLAHAYVVDKQYEKSRDLYQELSRIEPENPIHDQNYKQMVAMLSKDPVLQKIPQEVAEQAFMVDQIEQRAPVIKHIYPAEIGAVVRQALTDSELFTSYNLPTKAIPPLEIALKRAPKDSQVNQRLAVLYAKVQHYEKAAVCCEMLQTVYGENRYPDESKQFAQLAAKYHELGTTIAPPPLPVDVPPPPAAQPMMAEAVEEAGAEAFTAAAFGMEDVPPPPPPPPPVVLDGPASWDELPVEGEEGAVPAAAAATAAPTIPVAAEAAIASQPTTMETPAFTSDMPAFEMPSAPATEPHVDEQAEWESMTEVHPVELPTVPPPPPIDVGGLIEEIRFYNSSSMYQEAEGALAKLEAASPGHEEISALRQLIIDARLEEERSIAAAKAATEQAEKEAAEKAAQEAAEKAAKEAAEHAARSAKEKAAFEAAQKAAKEAEEKAAKAAAEKTAKEAAEKEKAEKAAKAAADKAAKEAAEKAAKEAAEKEKAEKAAKAAADKIAKEAAEKAAKETAEKEKAEKAAKSAADKAAKEAAEKAAREAKEAEESVHELIAEEEPAPPPKAPAKKEVAKPAAKAPSKAASADDLLGDLDVEIPAPPAKKEAAKPAAKEPAKTATPPASTKKPAPPAPSDDLLGDLVSDLEDSLGDAFDFTGGDKPKSEEAPQTVSAEAVPEGFSSMDHKLEETAPEIEHHEAANVLSDLFDEFKEDVDEESSEPEDPDTHYNLGIAFKEMGLYDEAIGELQKVCHALDKGHPFSQAVQAYTWLAQCFVEKGAPQASVRWYEKALKVKDLHEESRLAINYDLGVAHELSGNKKEALNAFMACYASNIDYRDVADHVKALKK